MTGTQDRVRAGTGPDLVFYHGTPWSSEVWSRYAEALTAEFTVRLWDLPGYGRSSKHPDHAVDFAHQAPAFAAPGLDLPIDVIWGAEDAWIPTDTGRRLAGLITDAAYTEVPAAGHLIQYDAPVELSHLVRGRPAVRTGRSAR